MRTRGEGTLGSPGRVLGSGVSSCTRELEWSAEEGCNPVGLGKIRVSKNKICLRLPSSKFEESRSF